MKKLINQVVNELASLGLRPSVLQELLDQGKNDEPRSVDEGAPIQSLEGPHESLTKTLSCPRVVYEFFSASNSIGPRLRLRVTEDQVGALGLFSPKELHLNSGESDAGSSESGSLEDVAGYTQITSPKCVSFPFIYAKCTHT